MFVQRMFVVAMLLSVIEPSTSFAQECQGCWTDGEIPAGYAIPVYPLNGGHDFIDSDTNNLTAICQEKDNTGRRWKGIKWKGGSAWVSGEIVLCQKICVATLHSCHEGGFSQIPGPPAGSKR